MECILESINSVNSANYLFNKVLSASAWSSFVVTRDNILHKALSDDLTLNVVPFTSKQLPSSLNETRHFHMHISISISEFIIPLCCRVSGCPTLHL